jgi:hypothetical protein
MTDQNHLSLVESVVPTIREHAAAVDKEGRFPRESFDMF